MQEEKELLSTQFKDLTQKFQTLLEKLENQLNDLLNEKNAKKNKITSNFLNFKDAIRKSFDTQVEQLRVQFQKDIDSARTELEYRKQETNDLKIARERIKYKRFFENDLEALDVELKKIKETIHRLESENESSTRQIEMFQKNWDVDDRELQNAFEREKERIDEQIERINRSINEIDSYIENSKNSFYGWLTEHYPDWENSVGKVVDEKNVLFNTSLSPKLLTISNNFYGIEIDLNEINKTVKTVADYENDKLILQEKVTNSRKNISLAIENLERSKENLKRKYQPKIREKKDSIKENIYLLEQNKLKQSEAILKKNDFVSKAESEKKLELTNIELQIEKSVEAEQNAKGEVRKIEEELVKLIKSREKDRDKKIDEEAEKTNQLIIDIEAETKVEQETNKKRKAEINIQRDVELSKKGADTKRLTEIENSLENIKTELSFIELNRDTVADYKKDKREYLDRVDEFKQEKLKLERYLEQEVRKFNQQSEILVKELQVIEALIKNINDELNKINEDKEAFDSFKSLVLYKSLEENFIKSTGDSKTEKRAKTIIDEIKEIHFERLHKYVEELRQTTTDFLGKFSDDNIFKFKKQLTDDKSFLEFASMLTDFIEERKIERIEKEVNERFSLIVTTIGKQANSLVANSGEILKVIKKINDDFVQKNFAGVIKRIELKVDESKNEIVQLLIMIKKYNDENSLELGEPNLFSSENQEKKNKEAVDLLKQFAKKISELKRDFISLSDSFELKFRVEENQNDTGWVEKLSNVGSDGTDVLVKAMVNIMLLNVFKEGASKKFKDFQLHCMMDEIGKLHPNNVRGILKFANDRNILLINSSPIENDALAFKHIYKLNKDEKSITRVKRILSQYS